MDKHKYAQIKRQCYQMSVWVIRARNSLSVSSSFEVFLHNTTHIKNAPDNVTSMLSLFRNYKCDVMILRNTMPRTKRDPVKVPVSVVGLFLSSHWSRQDLWMPEIISTWELDIVSIVITYCEARRWLRLWWCVTSGNIHVSIVVFV